MGGFLPVPSQTIYGVSKAAVKLLFGLNVPQQANTENKSMKILSAAKAVQIIIDGIENDRYRVMVGKDSKMMDFSTG